MSDYRDYYLSPLGQLELEADQHFLKAINFVTTKKTQRTNALLIKIKKQLEQYFAGRRQVFTLPLLTKGTKWQRQVWGQLIKIPYGQTISYGRLAKNLKKPQAARAVGGAANRNPIPIIIPCHRVIGAQGQLVGYAGGLKKKSQLLKLESFD